MAEHSSKLYFLLNILKKNETRELDCIRNNRLRRRRERIRRFKDKQNKEMLRFIVLMHQMMVYASPDRSIWEHERSQVFWNLIANRAWGDDQWTENFRMSKQTFNIVCNILRPKIERQKTNMRDELSVELRVATLLLVLGSTSEYRFTAHLLGISISSVCQITRELCHELAQLKNTYIKMPVGEELDRVVSGYKDKWGFPNCGGAIDGSHIPIISPKENHVDYYNRKGSYSIILQAICNDRCEFTDINVGWPGRVHDARVLKNSEIFEIGESGNLFGNKTVDVGGVNLPVVILGDPAYPLLAWLMKGFSDNGRLSAQQIKFNYMLSCNRMTIENSFGRLKGRWRRLLKRIDYATDIVPDLITACCVLHNICEKERDQFRDDWLAEAHNIRPQQVACDGHHNANNIREKLMNYFN
ncbi:Protein ALP1-like [Nymphon striatum]|nr:Protein ALP1-like [Nymphon striatum]KAG1685380.1 Protein ALP1-like [Nymphon striatum]